MPLLCRRRVNAEYGIGTRAGSYCVYEYSRRINNITAGREKKLVSEIKAGRTASIPGSVRASFGLSNSLFDAQSLLKAIKEIVSNGFDHYNNRYVQDRTTGNWQRR